MVEDYSKVCSHGNLERACPVCELEREVKDREDLLLAFCSAIDNKEVYRLAELQKKAKKPHY